MVKSSSLGYHRELHNVPNTLNAVYRPQEFGYKEKLKKVMSWWNSKYDRDCGSQELCTLVKVIRQFPSQRDHGMKRNLIKEIALFSKRINLAQRTLLGKDFPVWPEFGLPLDAKSQGAWRLLQTVTTQCSGWMSRINSCWKTFKSQPGEEQKVKVCYGVFDDGRVP